jgi:hypothetical protein
MASLFVSFSLGAALALVFPHTAQALNGHLEAAKGEFRLRLDDGRVLEREALAGARVVIGNRSQEVHILIDAVEEHEAVPGGPLVLYRLLAEDPVQRTLHDLCQPDARGRRLALPVPRDSGFDLTCTSGAEGKCILMGYRPWEDRDDVPVKDLHAACIRMVRADYGGDDHPATENGTAIDVYDRFGIQAPETVSPMPFEAAWGIHGALCVAHPRIARNITLEMLEQRYPTLRGRLGPEVCTEEAARKIPGALLFNRSAVTTP